MKSPVDFSSKYDALPFFSDSLKIGKNENDGGRRTCPRQSLSAPLEVSHFINGKGTDAQLVNHCEGGICITSRTKFKPGMSLFIRVKEYPSKASFNEFDKGLRSMSLADVRWCQEVQDTGLPYFKMGLQFYAPVY